MTAHHSNRPLTQVSNTFSSSQHPYSGLRNAMSVIVRKEGFFALYKGLAPTLVGIAPYAALNFATYDLVKMHYYRRGAASCNGPGKEDPLVNLVLGGLTGCFAATVCYPLDTIRRRMQMKGEVYKHQADAFKTIWAHEGYRGFYRGWSANILKVIPQNSIRFVSYEVMKQVLGIQKRRTDT